MFAACAVLVLLLVFLPWWFPWLLRPLAANFGARFADYQRIGYGRFALHEAVFTNASIHFEAAHVEAAVPSVLLWERFRGTGTDLIVTNWSLRKLKEPAEATRNVGGPKTAAETLADAEQTMNRVSDWISRAALTNGVLMLEQQTASVPWLVWSGERLKAHLVAPVPRLGELPATVAADFSEPGSIRAELAVPKLELTSAIAARIAGTDLVVQATNQWQSNQLVVAAAFREATLPIWARLSATNVTVPAAFLPAANVAATIDSLTGTWTNGAFDLVLNVRGNPTDTNLPALTGGLAFAGNTNVATLRALQLEGAGLRVDLSNPVTFDYTGKILTGAARLSITGALDRLPLAPMQGRINGAFEVQPGPGVYPELNVQLGLSNVLTRGIEMSAASVDAQLRWPILRVTHAAVRLNPDTIVTANGVIDLVTRTLSNATAEVSGILPTNVVPATIAYSNAVLLVEATGPFTNLAHEADVRISGVHVGGLAPINVRLRESGRQYALRDFNVVMTANAAQVEVSGSGDWTGTNAVVRLDELRYWKDRANPATTDAPLLSLATPAQFVVEFREAAAPQLFLSPLRWRGDGRQVDIAGAITWPATGALNVSVAGLHTSDFTNLMESPPAVAVLVPSLETSVRWSNGPVLFSIASVLTLETTNIPALHLRFAATNTAENVHLSELAIAAGPAAGTNSLRGLSPVLSGQAILPLTIAASSNGFATRLAPAAALQADLRLETNSALPEWIARSTGVAVKEPQLQLTLRGTFQEPAGEVHLAAESVSSLKVTNASLPAVEKLNAVAIFDREAIRLRELNASVAGQKLTATAELPINDAATNLASFANLKQLQAELRLPAAELSAFAAFATNYLAPRGTLDLQASVAPGLRIAGHIVVTNAATAVLPKLGPVHDIAARIRFTGEAAVIEQVRGYAGGEPFALTGKIDLADARTFPRRWPHVDLRLTGTNIAVVREAQQIIRTDLDLQVTNAAGGIPAVTGTVRLRDSLFLADLEDLVPGGVRKPSQRPPYFSVNAPLLRDWPLFIAVQGENFLNVRTPFVNGEASANLHLGGRLGEPLAVGEVRINEVTLTFPFAAMDVKQGMVMLRSEDPYAPQLFVTAAGRSFGYDLRLQVTGTAQEPILEFTSVPPLTSEQILLMVTTGAIPRDDYRLTTGQRAQRLGVFVGRNVLSKLGFGGGDRLSIRSGENISESGKETYSIEYKLTEDWSLVGEYDRFDEYNAGVKWRVFSK